MDRNLNQLILRELENLDKGPDIQRAAMKALKSYVQDMDSKMIPFFIARTSEMKDSGFSSGECIFSLLEILARSHGRNMVPHISTIMNTIVKTLTPSASSSALQQACYKVVATIARDGIDPLMKDNEKARIISSICKPLSNVLMGLNESAASGAALCLRALVESDNWRFASDDIVNEVCLKVAGALEETQTQTAYHMGLVIALSKHNSFTLDGYVRSLIRSGILILTVDDSEKNFQNLFSAIQMIDVLLKNVDSRSISSQLVGVIDVMEKCQNDHVPFIRGAAFEALQTAKIIAGQKISRHEVCSSPMLGLNFGRMDMNNPQVNNGHAQDARYSSSAEISSPRLQAVDSLVENDHIIGSPMSVGQSSCNFQLGRHVNRRLWNNDRSNFDVSLKDGFCCPISESPRSNSNGSIANFERSTPHKLTRYLQNSVDVNLEDHERQPSKRFARPTSHELEQIPTMSLNLVNSSQNLNHAVEGRGNMGMRRLGSRQSIWDAEQVTSGTESPSSIHVGLARCTCRVGYIDKRKDQIVKTERNQYVKAFLLFLCCLFVILVAVFVSALRTEDDEAFRNVVPT